MHLYLRTNDDLIFPEIETGDKDGQERTQHDPPWEVNIRTDSQNLVAFYSTLIRIKGFRKASPYPKPDESIPHPHTDYRRSISILYFHLCLPSGLFYSRFIPKLLTYYNIVN
jgi:hypothetical protein